METATVTCDAEGRIRSFDQGAERLFGYRAQEVVGRKRLQALTPGLVAIGYLGGWLESARRDGRFETVTALRGSDGRPFAAQLVLTRTDDGFAGAALALPQVPVQSAMPRVSLGLRVKAWMAIARVPFLTAAVAPVLFAGAWAWARGLARPFPWALLILSAVAAALLHVAANLLNDYFDWQSGADEGNAEFFAPFSGGSRAVELGLITQHGMLAAGLSALGTSAAIGALLASVRGPWLLGFGLVGAFAAWAYTAPPLRLAARRGLGELTVGLCFGPLIVAGSVYALCGRLDGAAFAVGAPLGLLTAAILWINEIPDVPADAKAGKTTLVVTLGPRRAAVGYVIIVGLAFVSLIAEVALGALPIWSLIALAPLPLAVRAARIALAHHSDRTLVRANAGTIQLQLAVGALLTLGSVVAGW